MTVDNAERRRNEMPQEHRSYFSIAPERLEAAAAAAGVPVVKAHYVLTQTDWSEGAAHQEWLDTAAVLELADWLLTLIETR
jgi:hypothetical protein